MALEPAAGHTWRLPVHRVPSRRTEKLSAIGANWLRGILVYEQPMFGPVTSVDYCANGEFMGASAANHALVMRLPLTRGAIFNEQPPRTCHGMRIRKDGRLVVQCIEQRAIIRSLDTPFERSFTGHTRDVRDAVFLTNQIFVSGSDDCTLRVWDVLAHTQVAIATGHTDYVRSLVAVDGATWLSGSYDRSVGFWDARDPSAQENTPAARWIFGAPVEKICATGPHSVVCAAGDVTYMIDLRRPPSSGDAVDSNSFVHSASFHTKTVSALAATPLSPYFLSGGLDHRVRVISKKTFEVVATKKFDGPVSALGIHPDVTQYGVGLSTGQFHVYSLVKSQRVIEATVDATDMGTAGNMVDDGEAGDDAAVPEGGDALHAIDTKQDAVSFVTDYSVPKAQRDAEELGAAVQAEDATQRAEAATQRALRTVRHLLAAFQYHRALRSAMYSRSPDVIMSTLDELLRRCALRVALSGHNDRTIAQVLRFLSQHVEDPALAPTCVATLDIVAEIYGPVARKSTFFHRELLKVHQRLGEVLTGIDHARQCAAALALIVEASE